MFWGLIMEPQRRYTQQVKKAFHISMAAMDLSNSGDEPAQVMCTYDGRNYLLCTLTKKTHFQCALDLNFDVGNEVSFATNGKSHIHLTGYLVEDADDGFGEEIEEEEEDEVVELEPRKSKRAKKAAAENGPPSKKSKNNIEVTSTQVAGESEDESDDSDFDLEKALGAANAEDEDDTSFAEEDVDDEEDEGEEEEDDEEAEIEESDEEEEEDEEVVEEEQPVKKVQMNGVAKKQQNAQEVTGKQKKQQQQQKQQQAAAKRKTLQGGVIIEEIREGQGKPTKSGRFVNVYYEGRLKQNNKLFDSTTKGAGFSFRLGAGEVIKGWDVGVVGMKMGGKRRIICPPAMAYGPKGSPPAIPPNSTLVFEVELKKIN